MFTKFLMPVVFFAFLMSLGISCYKELPPVNVVPAAVLSRDVAFARLNIQIHNTDGSVGNAHCTAFKIADDMIATAGHCCDEDQATYELVGKHSIDGSRVAKRLYYTSEPDVCVMSGKIEGKSLSLAGGDPLFGDKVWTVGYPSSALLMSDGYWTGRDTDGHAMCSVVVIAGASGSPVMNEKHEVVGILFAGDLGRSHNITYVTGIEHLINAVMRANEVLGSQMTRVIDTI